MHSKHYCRYSFYGDKLDNTKKTKEKIIIQAEHTCEVECNNILKAIEKRTEMYEKAYQVLLKIYCIIL